MQGNGSGRRRIVEGGKTNEQHGAKTAGICHWIWTPEAWLWVSYDLLSTTVVISATDVVPAHVGHAGTQTTLPIA